MSEFEVCHKCGVICWLLANDSLAKRVSCLFSGLRVKRAALGSAQRLGFNNIVATGVRIGVLPCLT
jgi:hypothetical protein